MAEVTQQPITWDDLVNGSEEDRLEPGGWNAQGLRRASDQERMPWSMKTVTFLRITPDLEVMQAKKPGEKLAMLEAAGPEDLVLVAWPGKWSQDIFVMDDRERARKALRK